MNNRPTSPLLRALDALIEGRAGSWVINLVVIPAMFLLVLVLPPLSLPQRVLSAGYSGVAPKTGGTVNIQDGTYFSIPAGAVRTDASIKLNSIPQDTFVNSAIARTLAPTLDIKSPAYQPSLQGRTPALAILSMPIPYDIDPLTSMDVYAYNGKKWYKLAFQPYIDETRVEAYMTVEIPESVVIVQAQPQAPAISADLVKGALPSQATPLLAEVNPVGLTIADAGGIAGNLPSLPEASASSPYQVLPTISNWDGSQYRGDIVDEMITIPDLRKQHIQALVDLAVEKLYPGINIDYQQLNEDNRADFTQFVRDLSNALHAKEKLLSVSVAMPVQKSVDVWNTGTYDWDAIGHAADIVRIPMPTNKQDYAGDPSPVQQYLQWAVGRVDRYKIQVTFSVQGRDEFGKSFAPVSFANAVKLMGPVDAPTSILIDGKVPLDMPKLRENGGIKFDAPSGFYSFVYKDDKGQAHTVWLETASSLAKKIALASQFNVRGISLRDVAGDDIDQRVWDVLKQYRESKSPTVKGNLSIAWLANGKIVGKAPATDPRFTWQASNQPGEVKFESALSFDDGQTTVATLAEAKSQVAAPAPTPVPTRPVAVAVAPTKAPAAAPASGPAASPFVGQNLFNYGAQLNWTNSDNAAEMAQLVQMGFKWAKVQIRWCDMESNRGNVDFSQMDRVIGAAGGRGIKLLFSVVCAPNWSRRDGGAGGSGPPDDMQLAADFMGKIAGKYCGGPLGAIEVWNEHNLLTEWHGKPISAPMYMDMLKRSYTSIKAACPGIVVVSGAPTPTGVMSETAIDDVVFLEQMYQNGLKQYSDAIGAHPSGFANPPEAAPGTPNAIGQFQGHRSFYFRGTMEGYRAVMVKYGDANKQIWPTEFGWAVTSSPHHGYEYAKFISLEQQAQWLVKSYQMMKAWGWVGVAILWNLDFRDLGNETGAFHVLGRPAYDALAGMAK